MNSSRFRWSLLPALAFCLAVSLAACQEAGSDSDQQQTNPEDTEELVRQYLNAYNEQDLGVVEALWADSLLYSGEMLARDEFLAFHEGYWSSFPDIEASSTHLISEGDYVAVRIEYEGTGEGTYLGHDVDGKGFEVAGIGLFHASDGRLDEYWDQWDELGFWAQLGAVERPYPKE